MFDIDWDYRETEFSCEACRDHLYRVAPSNLLICTNVRCTEREPLFLVEGS